MTLDTYSELLGAKQKEFEAKGADPSDPFRKDYVQIEEELSSVPRAANVAKKALHILALFLDGKKGSIKGIEYDLLTKQVANFSLQGERRGFCSGEEVLAINTLLGDTERDRLLKDPILFKIKALRAISEKNSFAYDFASLSPTEQNAVVDNVWGALPRDLRARFCLAGDPSRDTKYVFAGFELLGDKYTVDEHGRKKPMFVSSDVFNTNANGVAHKRGKEVLRLYLSQAGTDAYRGDGRIILSPFEWTVDHLVDAGSKKNIDGAWDQPENWIGTRKGLNTQKGKKSIKDFLVSELKRAMDLIEDPNIGPKGYTSLRQRGFERKDSELSDTIRVMSTDFPEILKASAPALIGNFKEDTLKLYHKMVESTDLPEQDINSFRTRALSCFGVGYWNPKAGGISQRSSGAVSPGEQRTDTETREILWPAIVNGLKQNRDLEEMKRDFRLIKYYNLYKKSITNNWVTMQDYYLGRGREAVKSQILDPTGFALAAKRALNRCYPNGLSPEAQAKIL